MRSSRTPSIQLSSIDEESWLALAIGSERATFFHTPLWLRLALREESDWSNVSCRFTLPTGVRGVLPLVETQPLSWGPLSRLMSTAFGCYGGPIAEAPLTDSDVTMILQALRTYARGTATLVEDPLAPLPQRISGFNVKRDFTDIIPLHLGLEAISDRQLRGTRQHIRKGRRKGVISRTGSTLADFGAYYGVYLESLRRWGEGASSRYSWRLFESLYAAATENPNNIALWLGELAGEIVSGMVIFYWNGRAVSWHAATSEEGLRADASSVLAADAIEDATHRDLDWFDFNPSGGHAGVAKFKQEFGADRMPMRILSCETVGSRGLRTVKRVARKIAP